jgi:hypothetical protein
VFVARPARISRRAAGRPFPAIHLDPGLVLLKPGRLPRTSGKIRRAETLRRWLDGTLAG